MTDEAKKAFDILTEDIVRKHQETIKRMPYMPQRVITCGYEFDDRFDFFTGHADGSPVYGGGFYSVDKKTYKISHKVVPFKELDDYLKDGKEIYSLFPEED